MRIALIIAVAEVVIMQIFRAFPAALNEDLAPFADSFLLIALSTPLIYYWVIRPFVQAREEAVAQMTYMAYHDPLTRLPNRRMLLEFLEKTLASCQRHGRYGALLLVDLDGFKPVNDRHGHDAGDALLRELAGQLRNTTRQEDLVCRLGGDEFIILIHELGDNEAAARAKAEIFAAKLQQVCAQPVTFGAARLQVGSSIGIRLLGPEKLGVEAAIREADTAMYRAKRAGRGQVILFEDRSFAVLTGPDKMERAG